jgi:hypothetical protein
MDLLLNNNFCKLAQSDTDYIIKLLLINDGNIDIPYAHYIRYATCNSYSAFIYDIFHKMCDSSNKDKINELIVGDEFGEYNTWIFDEYHDMYDDVDIVLNNVIFPESIDVIIFRCDLRVQYNIFNSNLDDVKWPTALRTLVLGSVFNQVIKVLPKSLRILIFGHKFNQDIKHIAWLEYSSMQVMQFGFNFNQHIHILPPNLLILVLGSAFQSNLSGVPDSLQILCTRGNIPNISVRTLIIDFGYTETTSYDVSSIPNSLNMLIIHSEGYNYSDVIFPKSLRVLILGHVFNQTINSLPQSLHVLSFGNEFNQDLSTVVMPPSLNVITFGFNYTCPLHAVKFHEISIVNDYACWITIDSCKFPKSLQKIVYYELDDDRDDVELSYYANVVYNRPIGQFTKTPRL